MHMVSRRGFIGGAVSAGAWISGVLPTFAAEEDDWASAFRGLGLDPFAADSATFVVIGDPHVREPFGYWIYGLKGDSLAARVLVPFDRSTGSVRSPVRTGSVAIDAVDRGLLPLPFEHEGEMLLWRHLIGSPGDAELRIAAPLMGDAGSYFFYVGKVVYRLPFGCDSSLAGFALLA